MEIIKNIIKLFVKEKNITKNEVNINGLFNSNFDKNSIETPTNIAEFKQEHIRALTLCDGNEINKPFTGCLAVVIDYYKFTKILLDLGLIKIADNKECLEHLKVTELKEILKSNNLKVSGKKVELVERVISNYSDGEISKLFTKKIYTHTELGKDVIAKQRKKLEETEYGEFAIAMDLILGGGFSTAYDIISKSNANKPTRNFMYDWSEAHARGLSKEDEKRYSELLKSNDFDKEIIACAIYSFMSGNGIDKTLQHYKKYSGNEELSSDKIEIAEEEAKIMRLDIAAKIRTVSTRNASKRDIASYKSSDIEEYIFIAPLDNRTCHICGALDGKRFKVSEAKEGINLPPMHEGCRCTTISYIKGMRRDKRMSRNPITNKSELIDYVDYEDWSKQNLNK